VIAAWIVGSTSIIVVGCVLAEAYDVLAKKYGWPR